MSLFTSCFNLAVLATLTVQSILSDVYQATKAAYIPKIASTVYGLKHANLTVKR